MCDKKELFAPLDIYLADEVAAAYSLVELKAEEVQQLKDQVANLLQQKQHLMNTVHRLESIALEESFRQESLEEVLHRLLQHDSVYVADTTADVMQQVAQDGQHVADDIDRLLEQHTDREDREFRANFEWLFDENQI